MKIRLFPVLVATLALASSLPAQLVPIGDESRQLAFNRHTLVPGTTPPTRQEAPRKTLDADGHLRHLGAAPGYQYPVEPGLEAMPVEAARQFLLSNRRVFGLGSPSTDVVLNRLKRSRGRSIVRLDQTYDGLPIFGAQALVQINTNAGIERVVSDLARDLSALDAGIIPLQPTITRPGAITRARNLHPPFRRRRSSFEPEA